MGEQVTSVFVDGRALLMVSFGQESSRRGLMDFKWFGILDLPFDECIWEHAEEEESIEEVIDDIAAFRDTLQKLRQDGWSLLYDWDEEGGRYIVTHSGYPNALEANKRLEVLGVKWLVCFDVAELRSFFK